MQAKRRCSLRHYFVFFLCNKMSPLLCKPYICKCSKDPYIAFLKDRRCHVAIPINLCNPCLYHRGCRCVSLENRCKWKYFIDSIFNYACLHLLWQNIWSPAEIDAAMYTVIMFASRHQIIFSKEYYTVQCTPSAGTLSIHIFWVIGCGCSEAIECTNLKNIEMMWPALIKYKMWKCADLVICFVSCYPHNVYQLGIPLFWYPFYFTNLVP